MAKKKSNAGRKQVDDQERIVPVTVYVKKKNKPAAQAACAAVCAQYR